MQIWMGGGGNSLINLDADPSRYVTMVIASKSSYVNNFVIINEFISEMKRSSQVTTAMTVHDFNKFNYFLFLQNNDCAFIWKKIGSKEIMKPKWCK